MKWNQVKNVEPLWNAPSQNQFDWWNWSRDVDQFYRLEHLKWNPMAIFNGFGTQQKKITNPNSYLTDGIQPAKSNN